MSQDRNAMELKGTSFLEERQGARDESPARALGPKLITEIVRLFRNAEIYGPEHDQTRQAAAELTAWLNASFTSAKEETFTLQLTEHNVFLNGQLIKLEKGQFARSMVLRTLFLPYSVNQLTLKAGIAAGEWTDMLTLHAQVRRGESAELVGFARPKLALKLVGHMAHDVAELTDSEHREIIELYAGLLVKCAAYFHQLQRDSATSARFIKRLVQRIASSFDEKGHVFIGLINLKLIPNQDFIHAVNTALYSMFLAHQIGLDRIDLVRIGMTALTQDIHRLSQNFVEQDNLELGQQSHFHTNMTSVMTISDMGATDLLSALRLVTSYERGFPFGKPLPQEWYREELKPHLLSRIIEIAHHYDLLTQGSKERHMLSPDIALQAISEQMGSHYDPMLTRLFINLIGVYPVGELVLLSTNEQALVIKSPSIAQNQSNKSVAHRPVVRLLDGSERILDLSAPEHQSVRIVKMLATDEVQQRPGAFFFF